MRQLTRTMTAAALAGALALGGAAVVAAQPDGLGDGTQRRMGPRGHRGPGGPGQIGLALRGLDLTDAQREQVRGIMEARKAELEALATRARTARQALQQAVRATPVNENAIRTASADVAAVSADAAVTRARIRAEVWSLLSAEQQQKAEELRAKMEERAKQRQERREQRRQQRPPQ